MKPWLLTTALVLAAFAGPHSAQAQVDGCNPPADGEWDILAGTVTCTGQTIRVKNVTVGNGAELRLIDSELILETSFDATATEGHVFWVNSGNPRARLVAQDSVIRTDPPTRDAHTLGGSGEITLERTRIQDFDTITVGASVTGVPGILTITDSRYDCTGERCGVGVWASQGSVANISGNVLSNLRFGLLAREADVTFANNVITRCESAVEPRGASTVPVLHNNTISSCQWSIIHAEECNDDLVVRNNDVVRHLPRPTEYAVSFCGDGRHNWWGSDPPEATLFSDRQGHGVFDYDPWRTVPVHPERLPTAHFSGLPGTIGVGEKVTLDASHSAPSQAFQEDIVEYQWNVGTKEVVCLSLDCASKWPVEFEEPGQHTVRLVVVDSLGVAGSYEQEVFVEAEPAHFTQFAIQPEAPKTGDDLVVSFATEGCISADCQQEICTMADCHVQWTWRLDGTEQDDLMMAHVPGDRVERGQTWSVEAVLENQDGLLDERSGQTTVTNSEPALTNVQVPSQAILGEEVTFSATGTDADGDDLQYTWSIGDATLAGKDASYTPETTGQYTVTVTVSDGNGGSDERDSLLLVVELQETEHPPPNENPNIEQEESAEPTDSTIGNNADKEDNTDASGESTSESSHDTDDKNTPTPFWPALTLLAIAWLAKRRF